MQKYFRGQLERVLGGFYGIFGRKRNIVTVFPKGTIVKYNGVPCKLLKDTPYYSETYKPK